MLYEFEVNGVNCVAFNGKMVPVGSARYHEILKAEAMRSLKSKKEKKPVSFLPGGVSHGERAISNAHREIIGAGAKRGSASRRAISA